MIREKMLQLSSVVLPTLSQYCKYNDRIEMPTVFIIMIIILIITIITSGQTNMMRGCIAGDIFYWENLM